MSGFDGIRPGLGFKLYLRPQNYEFFGNLPRSDVTLHTLGKSIVMSVKMESWKDFRNTMKWVFSLMGTVVLYAISVALYRQTLVEWWEPLGLALAVSLFSWMLLRKYWIRLWKDVNAYLLLAGHFIVMTGVALLLVLGINKWGADDSTLHPEQVTVEKRMRETHHHTQRVGRRHYRQGTPYYKYFFLVRFENGRQKNIEVSLKRYNRTRTGSTLTLELEKGFFGYPIIATKL